LANAIVIPLVALAACSTLVVADERPNIVFILADDLGLGDVSFYARNIQKKEPMFETPAIDALASQGLWFTDSDLPNRKPRKVHVDDLVKLYTQFKYTKLAIR
jgi:hypothetical protein